MAQKYKIGECVIYDTYGICKITEIKQMSFSRSIPKQEYYVLSVLNSPSSTYYLPTQGTLAETKLRSAMTEQEIKTLLSSAKECEIGWIDARQERQQLFQGILSEGISPELVAMIRCLYMRKTQLQENGKKLSGGDESVFNSAEKLVSEELAFSLGLLPEEVSKYIHDFMN